VLARPFSYLFLELVFLVTVLILCGPMVRPAVVHWGDVLRRVAWLFILWTLADLAALRLNLWAFPAGGTLPLRLLGLPLEEYLVFLVHSGACFLVVLMVDRADE
jgi:hypothetical protein